MDLLECTSVAQLFYDWSDIFTNLFSNIVSEILIFDVVFELRCAKKCQFLQAPKIY